MTDQPPHPLRLLSAKELAEALGRSERYIWHMRKRGFRFTAGRATLSSALVFLHQTPQPCKRRG